MSSTISSSFSFSFGNTRVINSNGVGLINFGADSPAEISLTPSTLGTTVVGSSRVQDSDRIISQASDRDSSSERIVQRDTQTTIIIGSTADDHLNTTRNRRELNGLAGNDVLHGGRNSDRILGAQGDDDIIGKSGNDDLRGGSGDDSIRGGDGDDQLHGNSGNDQLHGGIGDDNLWGDRGNDTLNGSSGNDVARGGAGNDVLIGGKNSDRLIGDRGNDMLRGGGHGDVLLGNHGDDTLIGGSGADRLIGGSGRDRFVLTIGKGVDRIVDFTQGIDQIGLSGGLTFNQLILGVNAQGNTIIDSGNHRLAILTGFETSLTSSDFVSM